LLSKERLFGRAIAAANAPVTEEPYATARLRDGRRLGYLEVGDAAGPVVIHCHGSGSSRLEALFFEAAATELAVRLIPVDRPGVGRSDPHAYENVAAWADDIGDLADQLDIATFAVQGLSNGGAYALACAARMPDRVTACGLISSIGPADLILQHGAPFMRAAGWFARRFPGAFEAYVRAVVPDTRPTASDAEKQIQAMRRWMSKADRMALEDPRPRGVLARALAEHRAQGAVGGRYEVVAGLRPWGFGLADVRVQRLLLWHGAQDRIVPCRLARALAEALPQCEAVFFPAEGHFSLVAHHAREILGKMK
jgi:pimeloyl-ACP methyl ester carboxylesterase